MPTYTYACTECGEQLEVVQSLSDAPLVECPHCSGRLRKVFHPVGVMFKGSGFYRTDSRASKESAGTSTGKKGDTGAAGAKEGSSASTSSTTQGSVSGGSSSSSSGTAAASESGSGSGSTSGSSSGSSGSRTPGSTAGSTSS